MVDFDKLRTKKKKPKAVDPIEIFRRLPKPPGINDLYTSQAEVLHAWFDRRSDRDIVLKLHTGGGKTMVGLLMAQSTLNETGEPVLYLAPTIQLVNQTLEKAKALGITAVPYEKGQDLDEDFVNGNAIMVATYNALFNGRSKFRLRGTGHPQVVSAVILDDAHVAFSVVRDSFTLEVNSSDSRDRYDELTSLFRKAFKETDRLYGGTAIIRMLAQRIEQGIGRGARGSGDHCVVVLAGADLAGWIAKDANFQLLTNATRAQMEMGIDISKEVRDLKDLANTIKRSFNRDAAWTEYHAETLAELVDESEATAGRFTQVGAERKAINLWQDGYPEKAVARIEKALSDPAGLDRQTRGWMEQLVARIADHWGNRDLAERRQQDAYGHNRNLLRPKVRPPYRPLPVPDEQAIAIVRQLKAYHVRRGFLRTFEDTVAYLHDGASSNQFEKALADLGVMIGFLAERHDVNGEGPDVLWLLPKNMALVIEVKSRKKAKNVLRKEEHGQLLVAAEWFSKNYPSYQYERVSVHPENRATRAAAAGASCALTYEKLASLVSDARVLLSSLCESQLSEEDLVAECSRALEHSPINANKLVKAYLLPFG